MILLLGKESEETHFQSRRKENGTISSTGSAGNYNSNVLKLHKNLQETKKETTESRDKSKSRRCNDTILFHNKNSKRTKTAANVHTELRSQHKMQTKVYLNQLNQHTKK